MQSRVMTDELGTLVATPLAYLLVEEVSIRQALKIVERQHWMSGRHSYGQKEFFGFMALVGDSNHPQNKEHPGQEQQSHYHKDNGAG